MNDVVVNEVNIIHAMEKRVNYCTGCFSCMDK